MGILNYSKLLRRNLQALDAPMKTYAIAQSRGRLDLAALAKHMSEHNSPFSEGVIKGVLTDMTTCVAELVCDGWIVDLGNLGTMKLVLKSRGVSESEIDEKTGLKPVFTAADITAINAKFVPGTDLQNLRKKVTLHEVLSLREQAEAKKAKDKAYAEGVQPEEDEDEDNG